MFNLKFKDWDCIAIVKQYDNGQPAIQLVDAMTGEPIAIATSCIKDFDWEVFASDLKIEGQLTAIKDYSENEGMFEALIDAGIVTDTGLAIQSRHVMFPIVILRDIPKLN